MIAFCIAVVLPHIDDRRQPTAVLCGEIALVERYILDGIGVEDREESHQVIHIVERHAVQENQVLVRSSAANIQARATLRPALHAGQELQGFEDIYLTGNHRDGFYLAHRHFDSRHLHRLRSAHRPLTHHGNFLDDSSGAQREIAKRVRDERKRMGVGCAETHIVGAKHMLAFGERQRIEPRMVGDGAQMADRVKHGGADKPLPRFRIGDVAADSGAFPTDRSRLCHHRKPKEKKGNT